MGETSVLPENLRTLLSLILSGHSCKQAHEFLRRKALLGKISKAGSKII